MYHLQIVSREMSYQHNNNTKFMSILMKNKTEFKRSRYSKYTPNILNVLVHNVLKKFLYYP